MSQSGIVSIIPSWVTFVMKFTLRGVWSETLVQKTQRGNRQKIVRLITQRSDRTIIYDADRIQGERLQFN